MAPLHSQGCEGAAYPRLDTKLQSPEKTITNWFLFLFPPAVSLHRLPPKILSFRPSIPTFALVAGLPPRTGPGAARGQGEAGVGGASGQGGGQCLTAQKLGRSPLRPGVRGSRGGQGPGRLGARGGLRGGPGGAKGNYPSYEREFRSENIGHHPGGPMAWLSPRG